jgi:hypothetical protein
VIYYFLTKKFDGVWKLIVEIECSIVCGVLGVVYLVSNAAMHRKIFNPTVAIIVPRYHPLTIGYLCIECCDTRLAF